MARRAGQRSGRRQQEQPRRSSFRVNGCRTEIQLQGQRMIDFFKKIYESDFLPHGTCYLWNPGVLWLNVVSDVVIALAYYGFPLLLVWFVRQRRDFRFNWIVVAFAVFMLACGTTHAQSAWTVWHATYRLDGVVKAIPAIASIVTALLLAPLLPAMVEMPNPAQVADTYQKLAQETKELE